MRLSFLVATAFLSASLAAHADTVYDFSGTLLSGTTFTGTIAYSPTGGPVLNGDTYTAVALNFSDGSVLNSAVQSTPSSGEHFYTSLTGDSPFTPNLGLVTTQVQPGFTDDPVCTLTQYCADEGLGFNSVHESVSSILGQSVEVAYISAPSTSVTPEPSSFVLLSTGLLGIASVMRKRFA